MKDDSTKQPSRRKFFFGAAAVAGTVAVVAKTPVGTAIVEQVEAVSEPKKEGYHLSAHIRKYYDTTLV